MKNFCPIGIIAALRDELKTAPNRGPDDSIAVLSGPGGARADQAARKLIRRGVNSIVVWGTCGALHPGFKPGDLLLYSDVLDEQGTRYSIDTELVAHLSQKLSGLHPQRAIGLTTNSAVVLPEHKRLLRETHGVDCVDMESAYVVRAALENRVPAAVVRTVVDAAGAAVPAAALAGIGPDGSTRPGKVMLALLQAPGQIASLIGLARDYRRALRALANAARLI